MKIITKEIKIYNFRELPEKIKNKVIEDWRNTEDYSFFLEDDEKDLRRNLETDYFLTDVKIYYDLSRCQGSGACFDFNVSGCTAMNFLLRVLTHYGKKDEYFPKLFKLYESGLLELSFKTVTNSYADHYCHKYTRNIDMVIYTYFEDDTSVKVHNTEALCFSAKKIIENWYLEQCDILHSGLESSYIYYQSDECIEEIILANDYEFLEDGTIYSE